ncbi:hypothetical protein A3D85_01040 [Candidatus Amesbacteria bacterium RIFCSPHIGHO2_02_FULL_47_9]|uniref:Uncharacterized protein n=1 Tax=Candidatus Amesbacteria bacterium RIFCSPHIGHO2_01_FULL_48_32b TaxID=1797253 RepID=A0A1F4YHG7_9BACT|nr:MAG: hypothetical protein A2876_04820 [Candidatus Amesbacteria bacterium RIFCSPHIGHO2_01_FULL_48_32b]OGD04630.1 MAG: hypothetical protein A3D85_01040 [Candidatus Amesbacteria bacterium RIFCSPHIGHO2_02_FULL_47_9]OGD07018.1 MAG: hypothetical protein A2899_00075 [Candidatus Amesbacteria bacterium RIFCSPLOWO2_01_FULL_49_25]
MQVKPKNPWEGSFENLTGQAGGRAKRVVADVVKAGADDVKKQIFGEAGPAELTAPQQEKVKVDEGRRMATMKQRMKEMDEAIRKAGEERTRKEQESVRVEEREKKAAFAKAEAAKKDPLWKKMLKGSQGSGERRADAGG